MNVINLYFNFQNEKIMPLPEKCVMKKYILIFI